jgi:ferritin
MNNNGLTNQEIKQFNDLLLKSNDYQLVLLLDDVRKEQQRRISNLKQIYKI